MKCFADAYVIDKFNGLGIFLDTYANSRHSYSFPRIVAMLGDGNKNYDHHNDGDSNSVGACSVSLISCYVILVH